MIAACALVLAACSEEAPTPAAPTTPAASSAHVRWVAARSPAGTALLEAPAQVIAAPRGRVVVAAPLRARILDVKTQPGATAKAGDALLEVALPEAAAAAGAYLAAADEIAAYEARAAQLAALAQEQLARHGDVAAVQLELARLRGARETAAATLRAAGHGPGAARHLADSGGRTVLRAPIAGTVTAVTAIVGASRSPEEPLLEISAGGATRVEARLPRPLPASARIEFVGLGAEPIAATPVATAPSREADGSAKAWFELATPAPTGATGRLRATLPDAAAVLVPAAAILRADGATHVARRGGARVPVRVLASSGADALVEGLAVGDEIAADAAALTSETGAP
ncbi:MAG: efflux RND transporter periplasmic adaptor subunit [Deltaproteobacteria bacterium]|nr:efflux RND transporter periplasmic adaptor subunit [Deltaproteobacteria bacterium]